MRTMEDTLDMAGTETADMIAGIETTDMSLDDKLDPLQRR